MEAVQTDNVLVKDSFPEYLSYPAISSSAAKAMYYESPLHYKFYKTKESEETESQKWGTALHLALTDFEDFKRSYSWLDLNNRPVPGKDFRTKANQIWKQQQIDEFQANGIILLEKGDYKGILSARENTMKIRYIRTLIEKYIESIEESVYTTDDNTGLKIKARPDYRTSVQKIIDIKSTRNANIMPNGFIREILKYKYYFQSAFHIKAVNRALDLPESEQYDGSILIAIENTPPYDVVPYALTHDWIQAGTLHVNQALEMIALCEEKEKYKGFLTFNDAKNKDLVFPECPGYIFDEKEFFI